MGEYVSFTAGRFRVMKRFIIKECVWAVTAVSYVEIKRKLHLETKAGGGGDSSTGLTMINRHASPAPRGRFAVGLLLTAHFTPPSHHKSHRYTALLYNQTKQYTCAWIFVDPKLKY